MELAIKEQVRKQKIIMRKKIVAGNWKMNKLVAEGVTLVQELNSFMAGYKTNAKVVIGVPFTHISQCVDIVDEDNVFISAQNCSEYDSGAYTGEVSVQMIKSLGLKYVIVGHSERREFFGDTDELVGIKAIKCLENGISPIVCCGETLEERESGNHFNVIKRQLLKAFIGVQRSSIFDVVIAYEPIWAIGTGQTASPEQAQEIHAYIREVIGEMYSVEIASEISILYGGSVKPNNAAELFSQNDIDGGLVGGASLKFEDFMQIIKAI